MPQVSGYIPNLVNGVSQQAPALRLPSQCEQQENFYPTLVDGLVKRPRTDWLAKLIPDFDPSSFVQFILRDQQEKYVLVIERDGTIRVFGLDGTEYVVNNTASDYLTGTTDTQHELRALTIADYTFIVNKNVEVAAKTATSPTRPYEVLWYVITGNYSKTYQLFINGSGVSSYSTPDSSDHTHEPYVDTSYIASQLYSGLSSLSGSEGKGRYSSVVYFYDNDTDFTASMVDGYGGRASKTIKGELNKFSDLPNDGPDGFVVKIVGSDANAFESYWVKFDATNATWKECVAPNTSLGLDATTMPHVLVRESDGTFTFKTYDYADRVCGNVDLNPNPSFVGKTIADVFFHRNRLGFLTDENFVLSEAGKFGNFFRTTLTTTLDTDPIDGGASHTKVSILRHALPNADNLLLFSDQTQFRVSGNDIFTPKTVSARPLTELNVAPRIRPVATKTDVYFCAEQDGWTQLFEFFVEQNNNLADVTCPTDHVPAYIPSGARYLAASPDLDLAVVLTDGDPNAMYIYKWYYQGQEKLQSAWSRWSFPEADQVLSCEFDHGSLLVLLMRHGDLHVERLRCEQRVIDAPLPYNVYLDKHVQIAPTPTAPFVYDATANTTTIPLPYILPRNPVVLADVAGSKAPGLQAVVENTTDDTTTNHVVVQGDWSAQPIRIGIPFTSFFRFSPFYFRAQNPQTSGKTAVNEDGRLQVYYLNLVYSRTAYFRVDVQTEGRAKRSYAFNGRRIGTEADTFNEITLSNGHLSIPCYSRNDRLIIDIVNDTWLPCAFAGASWRGSFFPSTREL